MALSRRVRYHEALMPIFNARQALEQTLHRDLRMAAQPIVISLDPGTSQIRRFVVTQRMGGNLSLFWPEQWKRRSDFTCSALDQRRDKLLFRGEKIGRGDTVKAEGIRLDAPLEWLNV